jgi:hypothetical protein
MECPAKIEYPLAKKRIDGIKDVHPVTGVKMLGKGVKITMVEGNGQDRESKPMSDEELQKGYRGKVETPQCNHPSRGV